MSKMRIATLAAPGEIILGRAEIPVPKQNEILVKVERVGVCGSDPTIYYGRHPYVKFPVVMGHEFSGHVAVLGPGAEGPPAGTRVTVIPHLVCGQCKPCRQKIYNFCQELRCVGAEADGAHCEYIAMPAEMVLPIPDGMTLDDGAMVEPASVAYHAAKRGELRQSDIVLVIGAGPIGNFVMQSAKALGAGKVFIADLDARRLELALSLGADGIINVSGERLEDGLERLCGGSHEVDAFFDCVGEKGAVFNDILRLARRGARAVIVGVLQNGYDIPLLPDFVQHELRISGTTMYTPSDYHEVINLMGRGAIRTEGMISHYFDFDDVAGVFKKIAGREIKYFKIMLKM